MILFRLREPGDEDWTLLSLEGELEEFLFHEIENTLCTPRYYVQRLVEGGDPAEPEDWETVNE